MTLGPRALTNRPKAMWVHVGEGRGICAGGSFVLGGIVLEGRWNLFDPCALCITYFWPLRFVPCLLLTPALFTLLLTSSVCALLTHRSCSVFLTYSWPLLSAPYILFLCITYSWPLGPVHNLILTHSLCVLLTFVAWALYATYYWPLNFVHCLLLTTELCAMFTFDPRSLCLTYSWSLHSVLYIHINPALYSINSKPMLQVLLTSALCALIHLSPVLCECVLHTPVLCPLQREGKKACNSKLGARFT